MKRARAFLPMMVCMLAMSLTAVGQEATMQNKVQQTSFGKTSDGTAITRYTLKNKNGVEAVLINYGATLVSLKAPDRKGQFADIVLGYDNVGGYENGKAYFGATVGRYANRIAHGKFELNGKTYTLFKNDGENTLHGGKIGFNKVVWTGRDATKNGIPAVEFTYLSKDGEEGFPGNLTAKVTYSLNDSNELKINYDITTDKDTVQNLTNHSYFNLAGNEAGDVLKHEVSIHADRFTPVDATLIPTGELKDVSGTPFDFRKAIAIGARIEDNDEQLKLGIGYDHNFVVNGKAGTLRPTAEVFEPTTGRVLQVSTTEPGVQFYTGNHLDGTEHGKGGHVYEKRHAFCLETQHYPDSPNHSKFPTTTLKAGQHYRTTTVYKFSAR